MDPDHRETPEGSFTLDALEVDRRTKAILAQLAEPGGDVAALRVTGDLIDLGYDSATAWRLTVATVRALRAARTADRLPRAAPKDVPHVRSDS